MKTRQCRAFFDPQVWRVFRNFCAGNAVELLGCPSIGCQDQVFPLVRNVCNLLERYFRCWCERSSRSTRSAACGVCRTTSQIRALPSIAPVIIRSFLPMVSLVHDVRALLLVLKLAELTVPNRRMCPMPILTVKVSGDDLEIYSGPLQLRRLLRAFICFLHLYLR